MRKVLAVIQTPVYGGPHNQIIQLYNELKSNGFEYIVVLPDINEGDLGKFNNKGIKYFQITIHRLRASFNIKFHWLFIKQFYPTIKKIRKIIEEEEIEIVQICGLMSLHGGIAGYLAKKKVVWQLLSDFAPLPLRLMLIQIVNECASVIMSTGRKILSKHPGINKSIKKVIFYPPVNTDIYLKKQKKDLQIIKEFQNPIAEKIIIGTVGNFSRQKSHDKIIEIAEKLSNKFPSQLLFLIIGSLSKSNENYYQQNVIAKATELNHIKNGLIHFITPSVPIADYLKYI